MEGHTYYNIRIKRSANAPWSYIRVHGSERDLMDNMKFFSKLGFIVETNRYYRRGKEVAVYGRVHLRRSEGVV